MTEPKYLDQSLPTFKEVPKKVPSTHIIHSFDIMVNRAISAVVTGAKPTSRSVFDVIKSSALVGPIKYVTFLKFTSLRTQTRMINRVMTTFVVEKDADLEAPKQPALVMLDNPRAVEFGKAFQRVLSGPNFPTLVKKAQDDLQLDFKKQRDAFNSYIEGSLKNAQY